MQQLAVTSPPYFEDSLFTEFIASQTSFEAQTNKIDRKKLGIFFTHHLSTIDSILDIIEFNDVIFSKKILEPSCGHGILIIRVLWNLYKIDPNPEKISFFVENNLFFIDISPQMIEQTKENINKLYYYLFNQRYLGSFNGFVLDFTYKLNHKSQKNNFYMMYNHIDYVVGNPPYVTLYGRRDQKKNESQRNYYLNNYCQFPKYLQNGKINYVMLFLEHCIDFLYEYYNINKKDIFFIKNSIQSF